MIERLHHYFSTYKLVRGRDVNVSIEQVYGQAQAVGVVTAALQDYEEHYGV